MDNATKIFDLFRFNGGLEYSGELVSQVEHAEQTAALAAKFTEDHEVILAAFLHDIGHLCANEQIENSMNGYGVLSHEIVGAEFLRKHYVPERIASLVEQHVQAKRYLTLVQHKYFERLSEASKKTLEFQGGVMTKEEANRFETYPDFSTSLQLRTWDEEAKIPGLDLDNLLFYENMLRQLMMNG